jgi:Tol biopolymer transport system component
VLGTAACALLAGAVGCFGALHGASGETLKASSCPERANFVRTDEPTNDRPSWAPNGRRLAFESNRSGRFQLYILRLSDCSVRPVTSGGAEATEPAWSPNGSWIAFIRESRSDAASVYVVHPDGSSLRRVTATKTTDDFPAWAPDSRRIVFDRYDGTGEGDLRNIYVIDVATRKATRLTRHGFNLTPAWSPNGKLIAWSTDDLWVMRPDGTHKRRVVRDRANGISGIAWSPESRWLAFVPGDYSATLVVVHPNGTGRRIVLPGAHYADRPSWSKQGQIAFTYDGFPPGYLEVATVNSDGTGLRQLTEAVP